MKHKCRPRSPPGATRQKPSMVMLGGGMAKSRITKAEQGEAARWQYIA